MDVGGGPDAPARSATVSGEIMSSVSERAKVAGLTVRGAAPERIEEARRDMRYAIAADDICRIADGAPPLTAGQRAALAVLLLAPQWVMAMPSDARGRPGQDGLPAARLTS